MKSPDQGGSGELRTIAARRKPLTTIIATALVFWLVQIIGGVLLFATWFIHFIVQLFACFGLRLPETSVQTFLSQMMKALTYPVRLCLPEDWLGDGSFSMALLLGANSAIWGLGLGTLIYALRKRRRAAQRTR